MYYSSGTAYGYDQIQPNMLPDNYDAPYSQNTVGHHPPCPNEKPNRTVVPPPDARPVASWEHMLSRPRVPLDSEIIGRMPCTACGKPPVPNRGPGGDLLQPAFVGANPPGLREGFGGWRGFSADNIDCVMVVIIFILLIVVVVNSINLRHLSKQVKILTRASVKAGTA